MNIYNLSTGTLDSISLGSNKEKNWTQQFAIDDSGNYSIQILSKSNNAAFKSNKEYLSISNFDIESEFLYQNKKSLHNFTNQNNAVYFDFKDLEAELDKIPVKKIVEFQQSNLNSLSTQYFWLLLIILLSIEWFLRKKSKLL